MHLDRRLDVIMLSVLSQVRANKNMLPAIKPSATAAIPPPQKWGALRGIQDGETRILALNTYNAFLRNNFHEPRFLPLPILRKALKSLT